MSVANRLGGSRSAIICAPCLRNSFCNSSLMFFILHFRSPGRPTDAVYQDPWPYPSRGAPPYFCHGLDVHLVEFLVGHAPEITSRDGRGCGRKLVGNRRKQVEASWKFSAATADFCPAVLSRRKMCKV